MRTNGTANCSGRSRRGVAAIQVLVMMVVLTGFAALSIDVGNLYDVKTELQAAADAAALGGASVFGEDGYMLANYGQDDSAIIGLSRNEARQRATDYAYKNTSLGSSIVLDNGDISIGIFDTSNPAAAASRRSFRRRRTPRRWGVRRSLARTATCSPITGRTIAQ